MKINPILFKDFYKADHKSQYPVGTEVVYSNFTARSSRMEGVNEIVVFGIQSFVKEYLIEEFNVKFFNRPKEEVLKEYKKRLDTSLGPDSVKIDHIGELHDLGYLPIEIKALPEGTLCPIKIPILTIRNTDPKFFWLTNMLETLLSCSLWLPMTSATIAYQYRKMLNDYARETSDIPDFVQWQGHDFSMRGHTSVNSAISSGAGHLLSFIGTDTIPAIDYLEQYYNADSTKELIGGSVPATEHSVMCMGSKESEYDTYKRLITQVYPSGIVSIVSDTWDYWKVLTHVIPNLKSEIMNRNGKVVIRPDSGDPVNVICGDPSAPIGSNEYLGTMELLWKTFGGEINSKGYKQLDSHIGVIYGDSITPERCKAICRGLKEKGFASTNIVFGVGSYTYQYVTRDTFGFAMKATYGVINGRPVDIFKDPVTDNGTKKSAKGLLRVNKDMTLSQQVTEQEEKEGMLQTVFKDGKVYNETSLSEIRNRLYK